MLVSAVIPAYNAEATIADAVESAVRQPACGEVIVVDDGSTDGTSDVASTFGDPVRVLSQPNRGVAAARNAGIAAARGRYVAFLDADDVWCEGKIEVQADALEHDSSAGLCFTAARRVDANLTVVGEIPARAPVDMTAALLRECAVAGSASSVMVRRDLISRLGGFDEALSQCADWDMWLRLSCETRFVAIPEPLVLVRSHGSNMSRDVRRLERDSLAMYDRFFASPQGASYRGSQRRHLGYNWSVLAGTYLAAGEFRNAVRCLGRAAAVHPKSAARALSLPWRRLRRLGHP